jgi:hypothetical protein
MNGKKNLAILFSRSFSPIESPAQFDLDLFFHNQTLDYPDAEYERLKRKNIENRRKSFLLSLVRDNREKKSENLEFIRHCYQNYEESENFFDNNDSFKKLTAKNCFFIELPAFYKKVALVGTYHRSELSSLQCLQLIEAFKPDSILIETDYLRYELLKKTLTFNESISFLSDLQSKILIFPKRRNKYI